MRFFRIAAAVALILLIPLYGTFFVEGWHWDAFDFVIIGAILFVVGLAIDFAARKIRNPLFRALAIAGIILAFIALWTELAVDAVSRAIGLIL